MAKGLSFKIKGTQFIITPVRIERKTPCLRVPCEKKVASNT